MFFHRSMEMHDVLHQFQLFNLATVKLQGTVQQELLNSSNSKLHCSLAHRRLHSFSQTYNTSRRIRCRRRRQACSPSGCRRSTPICRPPAWAARATDRLHGRKNVVPELPADDGFSSSRHAPGFVAAQLLH
jgi:hypothetical protein